MNINATVFVQMVHFLFAYFMLRHFLLKPAVAVIFAERAYRTRLENAIEQEGLIYIHKQEQQKEQWSLFQKGWQKQVPFVEQYVKKEHPELLIQKVILPQDMLGKHVQKIAQEIKERVDYVK